MVFRKVGSEFWYFGMGDICATLAVGWPAEVCMIILGWATCLGDSEHLNLRAAMND